MPIAEAMAEAEKMNATSVDRKHVVLKQQSLLDAWLDQQAQRALIQMKKVVFCLIQDKTVTALAL